MDTEITVQVDGVTRRLAVDTRSTLLDVLRERLAVTSAKKGCDHGQCGACTVLSGGRRVLSCLVLAVTQDGAQVVSAEGLVAMAAAGDEGLGDLHDDLHDDPNAGLHPVQRAFIDCDAFQCGYCTPGQVVSAVGMLDEFARGWPSAVTGSAVGTGGDSTGSPGEPHLDRAEVAERMSGNLCRCGAYVNIVSAIQQAAEVSAAQRTAGTEAAR